MVFWTPWTRFVAFCLVCVVCGCQPEIGDPCTLPSDCSLSGDRLCDTTLRGGYCTQFNCEPGSCPEEAVCVAYQSARSSAPECRDQQYTPRLERTFCMRSCSGNDDCRGDEGYACLDVESIEVWSAAVVERGSSTRRVCAPTYDGAPLPTSWSTDVCMDTDASFPDPLTPSRDDAGAPDAPTPMADASSDAPMVPADGPEPDSGPDVSRDAPLGSMDAGADAALDATNDAPSTD